MKEIEIVRYKKEIIDKVNDFVAEECIVNININSKSSFSTIMTPEDIKYFVYGNLLTEGIIKSKDEIKNYSQEEKDNVISINVNINNILDNEHFKNYNIIWTTCGVPQLQRPGEKFEKIKNDFKIKSDDIFKIKNEIRDKTDLFKKTGAYHYAFLFDKNIKLSDFAYDIGRHNAVDKVIGKILLNNQNIKDKILFTTGRITSDIVLKCIRVKIPIVITRSAPLYNAIILSKKYNICLIGFLRGNRFNIYSNQKIIEFEQEHREKSRRKLLLQNNC